MLLPVICTLSFSIDELEPVDITAFEGRFAPAGPMLLLENVLLSFPVVVPDEITIFPVRVAPEDVDEPKIEVFVIVLFVASAIRGTVEVPEVALTVVLESVRELPPGFSPLMVTLSAPFKLINELPAAIAPEIVLAAP